MALRDLRLLEFPDFAQGCPAFCDCDFPTGAHLATLKGCILESVTCRCGESVDDGSGDTQWQWRTDCDADALIAGKDVTFHPTYSQGTTVVRGDRSLDVGAVHFWEMRVITSLCGTDVMFGIATDKFDLHRFKFAFASALGVDAQSWGYSYNGKIHHNGSQQPYGQKFSQGCIVGVQLDRTCGRLEFFLNRRSLGVAFTNIPIDPAVKLYPMICSTAARSVVRLLNSTSQPDCLQLRSFRALSKQPHALEAMQKMPGLRPILRAYWFMAPPVRYSQRSSDSVNEIELADEAVLPNLRRRRKQKYIDLDDDDDINDLYSNAHKIALRRPDSDDEFSISEYFDEYFHYLF